MVDEDDIKKAGMSDQDQEDDVPSIYDQPTGHDWLLAWLIGHAEAYGLEFGITLTVSGQIISGKLISGRKYFDELRAFMSEAKGIDSQLAASLADSFTMVGAIYPANPSDVDIIDLKPTYIHLSGAKAVAGQGAIPSTGSLWRGKVASIDGFHMGQLEFS